MAGHRKLLWVLAGLAGACAALVLRTPGDGPAQPGRAAAEIAGYPRTGDGSAPFPGLDRATDPASTGLPRAEQGTSPPPFETAPLAATETPAELLLSPEASAAVTGSSAPGAEPVDVGAFLDPEGYPIEEDKAPVLVGDYLDPDSASNGD